MTDALGAGRARPPMDLRAEDFGLVEVLDSRCVAHSVRYRLPASGPQPLNTCAASAEAARDVARADYDTETDADVQDAPTMTLTEQALADALVETADAYHAHEEQNGKDAAWWTWYAKRIMQAYGNP